MNKGKVERNKKILELRLFDKLSNQEIADIYGISRQRVSRLCILWAPRFGLEKELEELHIELDKQRMNGILQKLFKKHPKTTKISNRLKSYKSAVHSQLQDKKPFVKKAIKALTPPILFELLRDIVNYIIDDNKNQQP